MTTLQLLALIGMSTLAEKDKKTIDPGEFFGIEQEVQGMLAASQDEQKALLKTALNEKFGIEWDLSKKLWPVLIEAAKEDSSRERALAHLAVDEMRVSGARKILKYNEAIKGSLSKKVIDDAVAVITKADARQKSIEQPTTSA